MTIDGQEYDVPLGSFKITDRKKSRITLAAEGTVAGINIQAGMWMEYDGFLWVRLQVNDSPPWTKN